MSIIIYLIMVLSSLTQTIEYKVCSYDWDCPTALRVFDCESWLGKHPDAYQLEPDSGVAQLNRYTWEHWFWVNYGWTWGQITYDDDINLAAAYIVYQEAVRMYGN